MSMTPEYGCRNCNRFAKWDDAVHAYEQAVAPRWVKDWTTEDWMKCVKWMFATTWDGREPHG